MRDFAILFTHLIVTLARLARPGGLVVRKKRSVATQPPSRAYIHDASRRVRISSQPGTPQADCVGARWREPAPSWPQADQGLTRHAAFCGYIVDCPILNRPLQMAFA